MKVIAVFFALLAVSLAAPSEVATADGKPLVSEKIEDTEKLVEKGDSLNEDKPVPAILLPDAERPEEKTPAVVVATSVDEDEKDEEPQTDEEKSAIFREYSDICRASTGATPEQVAAIYEDPDENAPQAVKCYFKCISEKYGVEQDKVLQKDIVRKHKPSHLTDKEFDKIVDTCGSLQTDDPCDSAYLKHSCYFRKVGAAFRLH